MQHIHIIGTKLHQSFLAEQRKCGATHELLKAGDRIVFCAKCKSAFLEDGWRMARGVHCDQNETLKKFPETVNTSTILKSKIKKIQQIDSTSMQGASTSSQHSRNEMYARNHEACKKADRDHTAEANKSTVLTAITEVAIDMVKYILLLVSLLLLLDLSYKQLAYQHFILLREHKFNYMTFVFAASFISYGAIFSIGLEKLNFSLGCLFQALWIFLSVPLFILYGYIFFFK